MTSTETKLRVPNLRGLGKQNYDLMLVKDADRRSNDRADGYVGYLKHHLSCTGGGECGTFIGSIASSDTELTHLYGHSVEILTQGAPNSDGLIELTLRDLDTKDEFKVRVTRKSVLVVDRTR
jgi:hypothetical protein